jgi:hypothetical protein
LAGHKLTTCGKELPTINNLLEVGGGIKISERDGSWSGSRYV